jgi:hypothetical protein
MNEGGAATVSSLYEALMAYFEEFPGRKTGIKTAIFRFLLPFSGFQLDCQTKANVPLSREETKRRLELTRELSLDLFHDVHKVVSWQEQVFVDLQTPANVRGVYKCHLNHFLSYCKERDWLVAPEPKKWAIPLNHPKDLPVKAQEPKSNHPITQRHNLIRYRAKIENLSESVQQEIKLCRAFWTDPFYGARPITELIDLETFDQYENYTLQIIGWLTLDKINYHKRMVERAKVNKQNDFSYQPDWLDVSEEPPVWLQELQQKYPPKPLGTFTLDDFFPVVELRLDALANEYKHQHVMIDEVNSQTVLEHLCHELEAQNATLSFDLGLQIGQVVQNNKLLVEQLNELNRTNELNRMKEKAQAEAIAAGDYARDLFGDLFRWISYQHNPLSKQDGYHIGKYYRHRICYTLMNWAKFRYRKITNPLMSPNYRDIPIVMILRAIRDETEALVLPKNYVSPLKKVPKWQELGEVLKRLLEDCAPRYKIREEDCRQNSGVIRKQTAVSKSFQRYLIVLFFRLVSPDRQHVIRNLKVGTSLKLCHIDLDAELIDEAPWNPQEKRYRAYYNNITKLYYLDPADACDEMGNAPTNPKGKPYEWMVDLDATETKIDKESCYRIPKIYNPELQAWLYGRLDYSGTWHNWPTYKGTQQKGRYRKQQFNWCGYVDIDNGKTYGFRDIFNPNHDFVFTQTNGKPFGVRNLSDIYDTLIWKYLNVRSAPHDVRRASTTHYKRKGMTSAQSESLAHIKSHSQHTQDSSAYNKMGALEKTKLASEMIVNEFLDEQGLDPDEYGLA